MQDPLASASTAWCCEFPVPTTQTSSLFAFQARVPLAQVAGMKKLVQRLKEVPDAQAEKGGLQFVAQAEPAVPLPQYVLPADATSKQDSATATPTPVKRIAMPTVRLLVEFAIIGRSPVCFSE